MAVAKVSIEKLWHFQCGSCKGWWSVGDYKPSPAKIISCPHCATYNDIPDEILTGDDFENGKNPPPKPAGPSLEKFSKMLQGEDYQRQMTAFERFVLGGRSQWME